MTDPEGVRPADSPSTLLNQFLELNPDTRRTGPATAARPCRCGGEVQFTDHGDRVAWKCVEGTCGKSGAFTAADLAARSKRQAPPAPGFILGDEDTPAPSGSRPALPVELDPGPLMLALLELAGDGSHDEPMDPGEADARMLDARRHGWDALPDRVKVRCKMSIGARVDPDHFRIVLGGVDFKTKAWKLPAAEVDVEAADQAPRFTVSAAADVEERPVEWDWRGRIERGRAPRGRWRRPSRYARGRRERRARRAVRGA